MHTLVYVCKTKFYYSSRDPAQNSVHSKKIMIEFSACKERYKFQTTTDFIQKRAYFGMKKESGKQRESVSTNLAAILKIITPLDPKNSKISRRTIVLFPYVYYVALLKA